MPSIKFRFNTECQMTIAADSYEEAYLQFKDFMHSDTPVPYGDGLEVCPPEQPMIFFEVDDDQDYSTIEHFKGDFATDIVNNCPPSLRGRVDHSGTG